MFYRGAVRGKRRRFRKLGSNKNWQDQGMKSAAQDALGALAQHMARLKALRKIELDETDRLIARIVHSLWRLVSDVEQQYDAIKGNGRMLDFDDLERSAIALLESERGRPIVPSALR